MPKELTWDDRGRSRNPALGDSTLKLIRWQCASRICIGW